MQVNFNTQNTVRPQFGMAIKATPEAMDNLVKKFNKVSDWVEFNRLVNKAEHNDFADVLLTADGNKIAVQVGPFKLKETAFSKPLKMIDIAVERAENLKIENGALVLKADENFERNLRNRVQVLPSQKSVPEPEINLEV